jgi:hypothetical protein
MAVERRIMNRPAEKPPVAGAENIAVKPKTVEERVKEIENYAYGIDPIIRTTIAEINGLKSAIASLNEEITKIAGIQSRANTFIEGKFADINETFEAVVTIVKRIDDDYQTLFANEEFEGGEGGEEPEPEVTDDAGEYLSTEPIGEYEEGEEEPLDEDEPEPEPEPEPAPVRQMRPATRPTTKTVVKPDLRQHQRVEPRPAPEPRQMPAQVSKPPQKPVAKPAVKAAAPTQVIYQKKATTRIPLKPETEPRPSPKEMEAVEENITEEKPKGFFGNIFKKKK